MFRRLENMLRESVRIEFEGQELAALEGDSVAAALLAAGIEPLRQAPVSGAARAPYCMMGVCFECLVEIDGNPHQQACLVTVRDGMVISRQPFSGALNA